MGFLKKKLVLLGDLIKFAEIWVKSLAHCADQTTSHMVAILGLNEAARVLVNAHGVRILTLTNFTAKNVFLGDSHFSDLATEK